MAGEISNEIYSRGYFFQTRLSTVDNGFAKDGRHNNVQSLLSRRHFHFWTTPEVIDRDDHKRYSNNIYLYIHTGLGL